MSQYISIPSITDDANFFYQVNLQKQEWIERILLQFPVIAAADKTYGFYLVVSKDKFATNNVYIGSDDTHSTGVVIEYASAALAAEHYFVTTVLDHEVANTHKVVVSSSLKTDGKRWLLNSVKIVAVNGVCTGDTLNLSEIRPEVVALADQFYGQTLRLSKDITIASSDDPANIVLIDKTGIKMLCTGDDGSAYYAKMTPTGFGVWNNSVQEVKIGQLAHNVWGAWFPVVYIGGASYDTAPLTASGSGISFNSPTAFTATSANAIINLTNNFNTAGASCDCYAATITYAGGQVGSNILDGTMNHGGTAISLCPAINLTFNNTGTITGLQTLVRGTEISGATTYSIDYRIEGIFSTNLTHFAIALGSGIYSCSPAYFKYIGSDDARTYINTTVAEQILINANDAAYQYNFYVHGTSKFSSNITVTGNVAATGTISSAINTDTKEPTGIVETARPVLSYDAGIARDITLTGDHEIYIYGLKTVKSGATIRHADTNGVHYLYYDCADGVLKLLVNTQWDIPSTVQVAMVAYNNACNPKGWLMSELHGISMDSHTHKEFHLTRGAYTTAYPALTNYTVPAQAPSSDANNCPYIAGMNLIDEDITNAIAELASAAYTVMYRGAGGAWFWTVNNAVPYGFKANDYIKYNPVSGNDYLFGDTEVLGNGDYVNYYIIATNAIANSAFRYIIVPSQFKHTTLAGAQAENFGSLSFGTLPMVEFICLYQVTFVTLSSYNTSGKCKIAATPRLQAVGSPVAINATISSHNSTSGRADVNCHPASAISNTPAGTYTATDMQTAINQALPLAGGTMTGGLAGTTAYLYSAIGPNDNVRTGLGHYDTTAVGINNGGQIVLGYKYSGTTYTEGAIIKMYKETNTDGEYGSGLKFQVRNNGDNLSTKFWINPSGDINSIGSSYVAANKAFGTLVTNSAVSFGAVSGGSFITSYGNNMSIAATDGLLYLYADTSNADANCGQIVFNGISGFTSTIWGRFNKSGNFTFGATDLASTTYKLFVDGIPIFRPAANKSMKIIAPLVATLTGVAPDATVAGTQLMISRASDGVWDNNGFFSYENAAGDSNLCVWARSKLVLSCNAAPAMWFNNSQNVTLGATDLAGSTYRLYVSGVANIGTTLGNYGRIGIKQTTTNDYNGIWVEAKDNSNSCVMGHTGTYGSIATNYQSGAYTLLCLQSHAGANVCVGAALTVGNGVTDSAGATYKLYVNGLQYTAGVQSWVDAGSVHALQLHDTRAYNSATVGASIVHYSKYKSDGTEAITGYYGCYKENTTDNDYKSCFTLSTSTGAGYAVGLRMNSSQGVTIGATDLAGSTAKLQVNGHVRIGAGTDDWSAYTAMTVYNAVLMTDSNYKTCHWCMDTTAYNNVGGGGSVLFGGKFHSNGAYTVFAGIQGYKMNATDNNYAGGLVLRTRIAGGNLVPAVFINDNQGVNIGAGLLTDYAATSYALYVRGTPTVSIGAYNTAYAIKAFTTTGTAVWGEETGGGYSAYFTCSGAGNTTGYIKAAAWTYASDARFKTDITYFSDIISFSALDLMDTLKSAYFRYNGSNKWSCGYIAQDVVSTPLSHLVGIDPDGYYNMTTTELIPYHTKAIQELSIINKAKDVIIKSLEERLAKVEALLEAMNVEA